MSLTQSVLDAARGANVMISSAESCTGGMLGAALSELPGSSEVFERGFITYSNAAKSELLGVQGSTLQAHGAVSEPVAIEMAEGALRASQAQLAVSITGVAGPGGSDHKPEGRVCFALASANGTTSETIEFGALGRDKVRMAARDHALTMLLDALS